MVGVAKLGVAIRELRLTEITFEDLNDCEFTTGTTLRELDRGQLAQLDLRYRLGIPRSSPDAGSYRVHVLDPKGDWMPMHSTSPDINAAANNMILIALISPKHEARLPLRHAGKHADTATSAHGIERKVSP